MCFMLTCFVTFLFNWLFLLPVNELFNKEDDDTDNQLLDEQVEFFFYLICSVF